MVTRRQSNRVGSQRFSQSPKLARVGHECQRRRPTRFGERARRRCQQWCTAGGVGGQSAAARSVNRQLERVFCEWGGGKSNAHHLRHQRPNANRLAAVNVSPIAICARLMDNRIGNQLLVARQLSPQVGDAVKKSIALLLLVSAVLLGVLTPAPPVNAAPAMQIGGTQVTILNPTNGMTFQPGQTIGIASTSNGPGGIAFVQLFVDNVGITTSSPPDG